MSERIYAAGCERIYAGAAAPRARAPFEAPEHTNGAVRLDSESVDAIARRLLELTGTEAAGLVDAAELARRMGVSRDWVYRHAEQLGAVRIGTGRRARLRFDPLLACGENRRSEVEETPAQPAKPRGRPRARAGTGAPLLPIRGRQEAA